MRIISILFAALFFMPLAALADDDNVPPITHPLVSAECGACHMAFQPAFLPAQSWEAIMGDLSNHFGEDASLDTDAMAEIEAYLMLNAEQGRLVSADNPPLRITELRWFRHEHNDREVAWLKENRNVKTMADCAACHRGADKGYFDDD